MFAVRYVALAALGVWLGGTLLLLAERSWPQALPSLDLATAACGAVIVACLLIMKFVGPPPEAFSLRAGLAAAMTGLALYTGLPHRTLITATNVAIGFVLLAWYARE